MKVDGLRAGALCSPSAISRIILSTETQSRAKVRKHDMDASLEAANAALGKRDLSSAWKHALELGQGLACKEGGPRKDFADLLDKLLTNMVRNTLFSL